MTTSVEGADGVADDVSALLQLRIVDDERRRKTDDVPVRWLCLCATVLTDQPFSCFFQHILCIGFRAHQCRLQFAVSPALQWGPVHKQQRRMLKSFRQHRSRGPRAPAGRSP